MAIRKEIGEIENIPYETKHIEWKIPDFIPDYSDKNEYFYVGPHFTATDTCWSLRLMVNWSWRQAGNVFIGMVNVHEVTREYSLKYFFGLKKCDGSIMELRCGTIGGDENYCDWIPFIKVSELNRRKAVLVPSNFLTVTCTITYMSEVPHSEGSSFIEAGEIDSEKSPKLTRLDKLSANFKDLYANKELCDVILKVQGQDYKAHKSILIARSSVFAANFKHDMLEKQTGTITISDCDPNSFSEFLEYLYSGKLKELCFRSALNLYYTSDKYNVEELKEFCVESLMQHITVESLCEIALLSDTYEETQLFSKVQDFFNENVSKILVTSEWTYLMKKNHRLANKLLIEMSRVKIENCKLNSELEE